MKLIQESIHNDITRALSAQFQKLEETHQELLFSINLALTEGVRDDIPSDLEGALVELEKRFAAARKELGLANSLPAGESRVLNKRRVMGNLNIIRNLLKQVMIKIDQPNDNEDGSLESNNGFKQ